MTEAAVDRVVIDASLALKRVVREEYSEQAHALFEDWMEQQRRLLAPSWFLCEVSNALHQRVRRSLIDVPTAQRALRDLFAAVLLLDAEPAISERALELVAALGRPSSYDCQYAALAEREGCELWTADERFWNAAHTRYPWIRWLGERA